MLQFSSFSNKIFDNDWNRYEIFLSSLPKTILSLLFLLLLAFLVSSGHADQLDSIHKEGVIKVAVFDSNPPFASLEQSNAIIQGYDVDFAKSIAKQLGVKLQLVPTNPFNRIPLLQSGRVDLIIADETITPERARVIDFSVPYFITGQQLLVPIGSPDNPYEYSSSRIGVVKGTTGQQNLILLFPKARILAYDDLPAAFAALRNGNVDAISQDSTILRGLLSYSSEKEKYKILSKYLSNDKVGIGINKDQSKFLSQVNHILVNLELTGEASKIYNRWFGPGTKNDSPRDFHIAP